MIFLPLHTSSLSHKTTSCQQASSIPQSPGTIQSEHEAMLASCRPIRYPLKQAYPVTAAKKQIPTPLNDRSLRNQAHPEVQPPTPQFPYLQARARKHAEHATLRTSDIAKPCKREKTATRPGTKTASAPTRGNSGIARRTRSQLPNAARDSASKSKRYRRKEAALEKRTPS
jgi:hypothetical protein